MKIRSIKIFLENRHFLFDIIQKISIIELSRQADSLQTARGILCE
jgi:hypothetical protein